MKLFAALTLFCGMLPAAAIADDESYLLLYSGVTLAESGDYNTDVSITYGLNEQSWLSFSAAHAPAANDEGFGLTTSGYDLSFGHDFDKLGYNLGVEWWGNRGELESLTYSGAAYLSFKNWRFGVLAKQRDWEFTPGDLEALLNDLDASFEQALREQFGERFPNADFDNLLTLALDLDTEVTGYGVGIDYTPNETLSFNLTHMEYDFSNDPGQSSLTAEFRGSARTEVGQNILARINQRLAVAFDGLGREYKNGLYDFTTSLSADFSIGKHSLAFAYTQDKDAIDGSYLRSFNADWIRALSAQFDLRLTAGASDTEARDVTAFGGIGIFYYH